MVFHSDLASTHLVTVPLEETWDLNKRIVFLGEWCLREDRRHILEKTLYTVEPFLWNDSQVVQDAIKYTETLYSKYLRIVSDALNELHGVDYGKRYWQYFLGPYLYYYIQVLYDKYLSVKAVREAHSSFTVTGIDESAYQPPASFPHFLWLGMYCDTWQLQLYSQVYRALGIPMDALDWDRASMQKRMAFHSDKVYPRTLKKLLNVLYKRVISRGYSAKVAFGHIPFVRAEQFRLIQASGFRAWPVEFNEEKVAGHTIPDMKLRARIRMLPSEGEFEALLSKTLFINMPYQFIERYRDLEAKARAKSNQRPAVIITSTGWISHGGFSSWCATCADKGTMLYGMQHGGNYGECADNHAERLERSISDSFITWGWSQGERTVPLSSSKLSRLQKMRQTARGTGILWVTTGIGRYVQYLSRYYMAGDHYRRHFEFSADCLERLSVEQKNKICLRLYHRDYGWGAADQWRKRFPDLRICSNKISFIDAAKANAAVIVDHLGSTTFLESISLDIPTIAFGEERFFPLSETAHKHYNALKKVGVIHYSPVDAADTINAHGNDFHKWWHDPHRRQVVKAYAQEFACQNPKWLSEWGEFLRQKVFLGNIQ